MRPRDRMHNRSNKKGKQQTGTSQQNGTSNYENRASAALPPAEQPFPTFPPPKCVELGKSVDMPADAKQAVSMFENVANRDTGILLKAKKQPETITQLQSFFDYIFNAKKT